ncbi:hypothetical protein CXF80_10175 [Shewanella sp. Actino-trap-3]|nr:hypothetical protein CXF80_10175 [Shewanella sp. Actino-trap-3]
MPDNGLLYANRLLLKKKAPIEYHNTIYELYQIERLPALLFTLLSLLSINLLTGFLPVIKMISYKLMNILSFGK